MKGPLQGVRVIDMSTILFAPYATQIMGDMGADIIKVEAPRGDTIRKVGAQRNAGMGSLFMALNRNKRSVVLDLQHPAGLNAFKQLLHKADVFIHNLRIKPATRLGITYQDLAPLYPGLIYCSTIGYNRRGPLGDRAAYDDLIQGASGLASLMGGSGAPQYVPSVIVDKTSGLMALNAVLMALFHKARSGEGQEVEVSMFEGMAAFMLADHMGGCVFEPPLDRIGYKRLLSPYRKPYPTQDGHICVLPYTDKHWQDFFEIAGRSEWFEDDRFQNITQRTENTDALYQLVDQILPERTSAEWLAAFEKADIPCSPVNHLADLLEDPQLEALNFFTLEEHPSEGMIRQIGIPHVFSKTPGSLRLPAPRLGEHSVEILKEAGMDDEEIQQLLTENATFDGR